MLNAEKARKKTEVAKTDGFNKLSLFERLQLKHIEKRIKKLSKNGKNDLYLRSIFPLVKLKLENDKYRVYELCGIPGTSVKPCVSISW